MSAERIMRTLDDAKASSETLQSLLNKVTPDRLNQSEIHLFATAANQAAQASKELNMIVGMLYEQFDARS